MKELTENLDVKLFKKLLDDFFLSEDTCKTKSFLHYTPFM